MCVVGTNLRVRMIVAMPVATMSMTPTVPTKRFLHTRGLVDPTSSCNNNNTTDTHNNYSEHKKM